MILYPSYDALKLKENDKLELSNYTWVTVAMYFLRFVLVILSGLLRPASMAALARASYPRTTPRPP